MVKWWLYWQLEGAKIVELNEETIGFLRDTVTNPKKYNW